jgi:hypothetical protein
MAWTTPRTWTTSETVTAAMMNEQVRDNESYVKTELDKQIPLDVIGADVEVVNTTTKTALWSFTLPANTLGSANVLEITIPFSWLNNTGGTATSTITLEYGGTQMLSFAYSSAAPGSTRGKGFIRIVLKGNGATNAQRAVGAMHGTDHSANSVFRADEGTATIDSTAAQTVAVYCTHGSASANLSIIARAAILNYLAAL